MASILYFYISQHETKLGTIQREMSNAENSINPKSIFMKERWNNSIIGRNK
jgi:hypothetical protein